MQCWVGFVFTLLACTLCQALTVHEAREFLGVGAGVTDKTIKKAYYKLAMKYHPDKMKDNPQLAETLFRKLNDAYELLLPISSFDSETSSKLPRWKDFVSNVNILLEEAYSGTTKELTRQVITPCPICAGHGNADGQTIRTCPHCGGNGMKIQQTPNGGLNISPCGHCFGGRIGVCPRCTGSGTLAMEGKLEIVIPPGSDSFVFRSQGSGDFKQGHRPGDWVVNVNVRKHPKINRIEDDLFFSHTIPRATASAGFEAKITHLSEMEEGLHVTIPPTPNPEDGVITRVFHGRGMPNPDGSYGNAIVQFFVR